MEIDRYPLPRIEGIFAELRKGELNSKIDLSQAYTELVLDQIYYKLKGLFTY